MGQVEGAPDTLADSLKVVPSQERPLVLRGPLCGGCYQVGTAGSLRALR